MLMPMFIVNSYKKKKIYTGMDDYEEVHEFNLQQVTYWEQYVQYQMELLQNQTVNAQLVEDKEHPSMLKEKSLDDYDKVKVLGEGCFGVVYLIQSKKNEKLFAMKQIKKSEEYEQYEALEQTILQNVDNPFLINVDAIFETKTDLYYIMPFISGHDLE